MNPQNASPPPTSPGKDRGGTTVDATEIAKFTAMAEAWWDPHGDFKPLHRFNPIRIAYIRDVAAAHFGRDAAGEAPFAGLSLLEVGCGGGLLTEPMRRLGAEVTGIDPAPRNIGVARTHAEQSGLKITYLPCAAEDLIETGASFDIVLAMEVVEHVADVDAFIHDCARLVNPGGLLFLATLNRTAKAFALAIVGAEYVLRWLPVGTHSWNKFVTPDELDKTIETHGLSVVEESGIMYDLMHDRWIAAADMDVNYMVAAERPR